MYIYINIYNKVLEQYEISVNKMFGGLLHSNKSLCSLYKNRKKEQTNKQKKQAF